MRNHITLISLLIAAGVSAQPALQYTDLPASAASYATYIVSDPGGTAPPTGGADQTWDLSAVVFAEVGTSHLGPAAGSPYASTYPTANYVFSTTSLVGGITQYSYLLADPTALETVAENIPDAPNVYSDHRSFLQFPTAFGGTFTDTYDSPQEQGSVTWTYVGYGTLITSLGTFPDQVMMSNTDGDIFFWNPDPLFPRFIANSDNPILLVPDASAIGKNGKSGLSVRAFPIPSYTRITVEGTKGQAQWEVRDMLGRQLLQGNWTEGGSRSIDIASLAHGQYLLQVKGTDGVATTRFEKM